MAKNHVLQLGKLVGNLQSLEALLRLYLLKIGAKSGRRGFKSSYWTLSPGDEVTEDEFTNYNSLGDLVKKFNTDVASRDPSLAVDHGVVGVRDLLAHGRVAADAEDETRLAILKFDKPSRGKVKVVASALMDDAWFAKNIKLVFQQIERVHTAIERHAA